MPRLAPLAWPSPCTSGPPRLPAPPARPRPVPLWPALNLPPPAHEARDGIDSLPLDRRGPGCGDFIPLPLETAVGDSPPPWGRAGVEVRLTPSFPLLPVRPGVWWPLLPHSPPFNPGKSTPSPATPGPGSRSRRAAATSAATASSPRLRGPRRSLDPARGPEAFQDLAGLGYRKWSSPGWIWASTAWITPRP